jgi:hypothetical protein
MSVWHYTDTRFCPILAPLLSFLGQRIVKDFGIVDQPALKIQGVYF